MQGHIFVAWGGNEPLARAVVSKLHSLGKSAIFGGDEHAANESSYLGENVRRQIVGAAAAIILIEDFSEVGDRDRRSPIGEFRPNMVFEWGYALAALPKTLVFPALIGFRERLPTDMLGLWIPEFPRYDRSDQNSITSLAEIIVTRLLVSLDAVECHLPKSPFDVLSKWPDVLVALSAVRHERKAFLRRHLQEFMPSIAIPAVYDGCRASVFKLIQTPLTDENPPEIGLVQTILEYYAICDSRRPTENELRRINYALIALKSLQFVSVWPSIMLNNFSGIIERKLGELTGNTLPYDAFSLSEERLSMSLRLLNDYAEQNPLDQRSVIMWRGFICWNLSRLYNAMNMQEARVRELERARLARRNLYFALSGGDTSTRIRTEILLEQLTVEIEAAKLGLAPAHGLAENALSEVRATLRTNGRAVWRVVNALREYADKTEDLVLTSEVEEIHRSLIDR